MVMKFSHFEDNEGSLSNLSPIILVPTEEDEVMWGGNGILKLESEFSH